MRLKARDMRDPYNVAEAVAVLFNPDPIEIPGGRPSPIRIPGVIARCTAPAAERRKCGGWAYALGSRPGVWACTAPACRQPMVTKRRPSGRIETLPTDCRRDGYMHGPWLSMPLPHRTRIEPLARHWVRRYVQEATAHADPTVSAAARYVIAAPGSKLERDAERELDAMISKRTYERIQANRNAAQMRLFRHVASRFKADVPWRPRCSVAGCLMPVAGTGRLCRDHGREAGRAV